ncbi:MAG: hypothetical protein ABI675_24305 [Chitinophagaceae bacterium]
MKKNELNQTLVATFVVTKEIYDRFQKMKRRNCQMTSEQLDDFMISLLQLEEFTEADMKDFPDEIRAHLNLKMKRNSIQNEN